MNDDGFKDATPKDLKILSWPETFVEVIKASVPTVLSNIFFFLIQLTNIWYMGRQDEAALLAAVGMGNMLINVCCLAVCQGFNGTIETFVSQSFGGKQWFMCGVQFNRGRIIVSLIFIPIAILFFFSDNILIACMQDPYISKISRDYIVWALPGLFCIVNFDARKRQMQSMRYSSVSTKTQAFTWVLHLFWCYLLITRLGAGVFGASMALNVTYILTFAIQEFYVNVYKWSEFKKYQAALFHEESFLDWPIYIKLAIPTTGLMCIEWWAFEFIVIFAGIIGV